MIANRRYRRTLGSRFCLGRIIDFEVLADRFPQSLRVDRKMGRRFQFQFLRFQELIWEQVTA
jgi:hypothetical protein